jgi:hypothetical protein
MLLQKCCKFLQKYNSALKVAHMQPSPHLFSQSDLKQKAHQNKQQHGSQNLTNTDPNNQPKIPGLGFRVYGFR